MKPGQTEISLFPLDVPSGEIYFQAETRLGIPHPISLPFDWLRSTKNMPKQPATIPGNVANPRVTFLLVLRIKASV
jgi:hypothetical protein